MDSPWLYSVIVDVFRFEANHSVPMCSWSDTVVDVVVDVVVDEDGVVDGVVDGVGTVGVGVRVSGVADSTAEACCSSSCCRSSCCTNCCCCCCWDFIQRATGPGGAAPEANASNTLKGRDDDEWVVGF